MIRDLPVERVSGDVKGMGARNGWKGRRVSRKAEIAV